MFEALYTDCKQSCKFNLSTKKKKNTLEPHQEATMLTYGVTDTQHEYDIFGHKALVRESIKPLRHLLSLQISMLVKNLFTN